MESRLDYRLKLRAREKFIIETILPAGSLHLIGGPSGIGKTTWLFQLLYEWTQGKTVLGSYKSFPCEWVYVSCDRSLVEADRTLRRLGLGDWDAPIYSIEEVQNEPSVLRLPERFPEAELYVVEGLQGFMPDIPKGRSQNKAEMLWMMKLRKELFKLGKTVIATTHTRKMKWGEETDNARSAFLGSNALIGCASTLIEFDLPKDVKASKKRVDTEERVVHLRGRDFRDIQLRYTRDDNGRFVVYDDSVQIELAIDMCLISHPKSQRITTKLMEGWAEKAGMNRAALYRWIEKQIAAATMERVDRGVYKKPGGGLEPEGGSLVQ